MATKKVAKKTTPTEKTDVNGQVASKETPVKKSSAKKTVIKKAATRKTAANKIASKSSTGTNQNNTAMLSTIESVINEMRREYDSRDKQITLLVQEIRRGFGDYSERFSQQEADREKETTKLYQTLQNTFSTMEGSENERENRSQIILKSLSDSIIRDHEQTLIEVHEQEKVQDKKLQQLDKIYQRRTGRNRLIAIPGIIIAIIAIIYMFYVVTIMEEAMTSMSGDMHKIQIAVKDMSNNMNMMSTDTNSMNRNMTHLNNNVSLMSRDLNILTYNVAPTMKGMRDMMPWSP